VLKSGETNVSVALMQKAVAAKNALKDKKAEAYLGFLNYKKSV